MSTPTKSFRAAAIGVSLTLATAFALNLAASEAAIAKNAKSESAKSGNANGHSKSNGKSAPGEGKSNSGNGNSASKLGALNAAHASENALLHADPNSRVGRIALYRDTVVATQAIEADRDAAVAALGLLEEPARGSDAVSADLELNEIARSDLEDEISQLQDALDLAGGADPVIETQLEAAGQQLGLLEGEAQQLQDELGVALAYESAVSVVADFDAALAERALVERSLLEAAANKPVDDLVESEVLRLLGLD